MQTGLACDDYDDASPGGELRMMKSPDWVRFMLETPPAPVEPGVGRYCSGAPVSVGRLIELRSGKPLPAYAQERLFGPLGIASSGCAGTSPRRGRAPSTWPGSS
jgi:CubicO group peptidase (beta-lactamase class C family)